MSLIDQAAQTAATALAPEIAVPLRAWGWAKARAVPLLLAALALVLLILAIVAAINHFSGAKRTAAVATLAASQGNAAMVSGSDATSTIEARDTADHNTEGTVSHAQSAIQAATDTSGADAAGRSGLCAIAADLCPAGGMQQPAAH